MRTSTSTPPDTAKEGYEELRLALVMTGGVSLAVWMGGVVTEFYLSFAKIPPPARCSSPRRLRQLGYTQETAF